MVVMFSKALECMAAGHYIIIISVKVEVETLNLRNEKPNSSITKQYIFITHLLTLHGAELLVFYF